MNIEGRIVAVTGAASGIGAALAEKAASRGAAAVAVIDLDQKAAQEVAKRITAGGAKAQAYGVDIADHEAVAEVATRVAADLGTPGLVCANAGVNPDPAPLLDGDVRNLMWTLSVNVVGTWATLRAFGRLMAAETAPGRLLVTASEHAIGVPFPGNGFYTASKHAVLGLADVMRRELPEHLGISVVLPGLVATGLWRSGSNRPDSLGGPSSADELAQALLARGMDAGDVADLALDGALDGRFLIATHAHAHRYAEARSDDVTEAFRALRATGRPEVSYDVMEIFAELTNAANG